MASSPRASLWKAAAFALGFLTILPVPKRMAQEISARDLAASLGFYPLVGCILGILSLCFAYPLSGVVPLPILAVLVTILHAMLTRFFHLDGLADLADGLWGGYTPERRLEIMKDSHTGSFGAAAVSLILLLKSASYFSLLSLNAWPVLVMVPTLSRTSVVVAAWGSSYARKEGGLGRAFLDHMKLGDLVTAALLGAAISCSASIVPAAPMLITAVVCGRALKWLAHRMLGGVTGDVLGAVNELTEAVLLIVAGILSQNLT